MNEYQQQLFNYLQQYELTDETEESFAVGLQDSANARQLYQWLKDNNHIDESEDEGTFVNS